MVRLIGVLRLYLLIAATLLETSINLTSFPFALMTERPVSMLVLCKLL
jgi:hypothetical protein